MKKLRGLKKAVGDYQNNCKRLHCVICLDLEDGHIWTDVYADSNSYSVYHSKSIHALNTYFMDACGSELPVKITMQSVRKTAEFVAAKYAGKEEER